jgi:hypothetical protein
MHIVVSASILSTASFVITTGALLLSIVFGIVLGYHWYRFALSPLAATGALALYAAGCVLLLTLLYITAPLLLLL